MERTDGRNRTTKWWRGAFSTGNSDDVADDVEDNNNVATCAKSLSMDKCRGRVYLV